MIKVDVGESFPITVVLIDDSTGTLVSGATVYYDVRNIDDTSLSPAINGTLTESSVESGVYKTTITINESGNYICYATADTFLTSTEEIIVNPENIYDLIKREQHYNLSIEDVHRTTQSPNASQAARNVPKNRTDYVITKIKADDASDWSNPVSSGIVYAHYRDSNDRVPYKMAGPY